MIELAWLFTWITSGIGGWIVGSGENRLCGLGFISIGMALSLFNS